MAINIESLELQGLRIRRETFLSLFAVCVSFVVRSGAVMVLHEFLSLCLCTPGALVLFLLLQ